MSILSAIDKSTASARIEAASWNGVITDLWSQGYARLGTLLNRAECEELRALYAQAPFFRSRVEMARYRFGRGEYQYFAYPLPKQVVELRQALYANLAGVAGDWMKALGLPGIFPTEHDGFLELCHQRGQTRPTPLLLRYRDGDFNCLHQDVYGEVVFPLQVIIGLSRSGEEFTGGELLLVEQQPRAQSVGHVISLSQGEAVVISTRYRPAKSARGYYRASMRHGVSRIHSGERYTLGIIFHDAE